MACRDFEQRVALYIEDDLDAVARHATERHLRLCAGCAALAEELRESQAIFKSLRQNIPDETMLSSVRNEVFADIRSTSQGWHEVFFGIFRQRATLAAVILFLVGSVLWTHEERAPVHPVPATPATVAPPVVVPSAASLVPTPHVAAVKPKARRPKPRTPVDSSEPKPQVTIKLLTDDPNIIIYWIVDGNGD